jgi:hypothetical protein
VVVVDKNCFGDLEDGKCRLLGVVGTIAKDLKCKVSQMVGEEVYMLV